VVAACRSPALGPPIGDIANVIAVGGRVNSGISGVCGGRPKIDGSRAKIRSFTGKRNSLRLVWEAHDAGISVSLACALVEQESSFDNVFGHDHDPAHPALDNPVRGGAVTEARYRALRRFVAGGFHSNGVGLTQLTSVGFLDQADAIGGAWKPKHQLRVGFRTVAGHIHHFGDERKGLAAYNAGPGNVEGGLGYADSVLELKRKWHARLT
jgi:Transglycosylase SLT domain